MRHLTLRLITVLGLCAIALHSEAQSLSAISEIEFDVPGAQNAPFQGTVMVGGWALNSAANINRLTIIVDGESVGAATLGGYRSDVCKLYSNPNCLTSGWFYYLDTTQFANGMHALEATATLSNGGHMSAGSSFTVENWAGINPFRINIDNPVANSSVTGLMSINGWASAGSTPITKVAIAVDGRVGTATIGPQRADVCVVIPNNLACPNVSFNTSYSTVASAAGTHTLQVTAATAGGQASTTTTIFNVGNPPILVNVDNPAQGSVVNGTIVIGGWAVSSVYKVYLANFFLDGLQYPSTFVRTARPDVCTVYPSSLNCPNVGWNIGFDTTQLANGTHTIQAVVGDSSGLYFGMSPINTFTVSNSNSSSPPFTIFVDQPVAGGSVLGLTTFSGWALLSNAKTNNVLLSIDHGGQLIGANYGLSRPDVCAVFPGEPDCPNVGWNLLFDTRVLTPGPHTLTVSAIPTNLTGAREDISISTTFNVANWSTTGNPINISIDRPNAQTGPLSGVTNIGGWAFDSQAQIASVSIAVDGIGYGPAAYGGYRPDVCSIYPNQPGCPNIGWNALLDTTYLSDGTHTLDVTVTPVAGQSFTASAAFNVANLPGNPIRINLDNAQGVAVTGTASIFGWAISDTAAIVSVQIAVDGIIFGTANYGLGRPDVCVVFPGRSGCPNVGWNYPLDTSLFANGTHTLQIIATDSNGKRETISSNLAVSN